MINCTDNLCKHVQIIVTIENDKTECRLSHLIKKYNTPFQCPCIECIVRSTCIDACQQKRILVATIHAYSPDAIKDYEHTRIR
jgi:hypothetical protein